ncbi:ArsR family transcriptional regulator [candidate division Kazan bacterium]|uniref:ArsR family transcriptional regulator n=1 Tax=candidate division Kazan bacterium TaxID=2202143 RepID=A0A420ZAX6_UNCK3|nr:MAG: ArsR family transcriptional regulator [candidate division Kazan bacterium]
MSRFKVDERLERLVSSPICPAEDASKYAKELKGLADKVAEKSLAKRESRFFKALADENRIRMIKLLTMREMCVCELMVALDLTQPTTSHHLNILERKGLIKKRKEGKWSYYSIADSKLIEGLRDLGLLK